MKKLKNLFVILYLTAININGFTQISHKGTPLSFSKSLSNNIPTYITKSVNISSFVEEDKVTDMHKDIPWRFGVKIPSNITLNNSGTWEKLANGDRVWRLTITSPNAKSINLNYDNFYLPKGATFYIYNKNGVLGGFNSTNNKVNREFSTSLLKGNTITLEYYEPKSKIGKGIIQIASIVHGYRDLYSKLKAFGSSGACNINSVCDSIIWGDQIRSTVMTLTAGNTRMCSAALINNTSQDGTPYVLGGDHCGPSSNDIFMFNYQSPDCAINNDGSTSQTISGCTIVSNNDSSDFFLVKLSSIPPANYNVFYSGWSAIDTPSIRSTGIHHPSGDVKKISHDHNPVVSSGYYTIGNNDHWSVLDWDAGTTEGGSSGSPLFDQNHRIVGQLHGGDAACGNDFFDYYGKFAVSWDANMDTLKQLKHWLDPTNTGIKIIDGYDPNGPAFLTDATVLNITGIDNKVCGESISPTITIQNKGSNNLTSLDIYYTIDNGTPILINWNGNISPYGTATINLPTLTIGNGNHNFTSYSVNPNSSTDQNLLNDTLSFDFTSTAIPFFATLKLTTDDYGNESSWIIKETISGNIVLEGGGYPSVNGGITHTEKLCLFEACFTFELKDSQNDGYCCTFGNGNLLLTEDITGDTLAIDSTFNNSSITFPFCMGTVNGINEIEKNNINLYPNPNNGSFTLSSSSTIKDIKVINLLGKIIYQNRDLNKSEVNIKLNNIDKGIYLVITEIENQRRAIRKVIIK